MIFKRIYSWVIWKNKGFVNFQYNWLIFSNWYSEKAIIQIAKRYKPSTELPYLEFDDYSTIVQSLLIRISYITGNRRDTRDLLYFFYFSGEYHINRQFIPLQSCDYLKKTSIERNVATDEGNSWNEISDTKLTMKLE